MPKCKHESRRYSKVTFRNGTQHVAMNCEACEKHLGFAPQRGIEVAELPSQKTVKQERAELGLPTGCLACFSEQKNVFVNGCCFDCRKLGHHKKIKRFAREHGVKIWALSKEQLFSCLSENPGADK